MIAHRIIFIALSTAAIKHIIYINAGVQVPCIARTSAAMILALQNKQAILLHEKEFKLSVPISVS